MPGRIIRYIGATPDLICNYLTKRVMGFEPTTFTLAT